MKLLFPKGRRRPKKKLISRPGVKNDPEEYGRKHIVSIHNEEGWYQP